MTFTDDIMPMCGTFVKNDKTFATKEVNRDTYYKNVKIPQGLHVLLMFLVNVPLLCVNYEE